MARKVEVNGSVVRAWATSTEGQAFLVEWAAKAEKPVPTVGKRGKFSADLLTAFHKGNPRSRYVEKLVPTRTISGTRVTDSGRKVPVKVVASLSEVRAFARAEGLQVGDRGRISADVYAAFAARPKA